MPTFTSDPRIKKELEKISESSRQAGEKLAERARQINQDTKDCYDSITDTELRYMMEKQHPFLRPPGWEPRKPRPVTFSDRLLMALLVWWVI